MQWEKLGNQVGGYTLCDIDAAVDDSVGQVEALRRYELTPLSSFINLVFSPDLLQPFLLNVLTVSCRLIIAQDIPEVR